MIYNRLENQNQNIRAKEKDRNYREVTHDYLNLKLSSELPDCQGENENSTC